LSGPAGDLAKSIEPRSWAHSTSIVDRGPVLVVDASCLFEALTGTVLSEPIRQRLALDEDQAAPHVIDVEVFSAIRREHRLGLLDRTAADQAVDDLEAWPGERFGHRLLLARAWELRDNVRGWDAMYVALAEALDAILLTTDTRLAAAPGPTCRIELPV
jgi:predicted nucleic acid-binding protein